MTSPEELHRHDELAHRLARILARHGHRRQARPLQLPTVAGLTPVYGPGVILLGWSGLDTSGAANTLTIRSGPDATGQVVAVGQAALNGPTAAWFGPIGILCQGGLSVQLTGTMAGSLYVHELD